MWVPGSFYESSEYGLGLQHAGCEKGDCVLPQRVELKAHHGGRNLKWTASCCHVHLLNTPWTGRGCLLGETKALLFACSLCCYRNSTACPDSECSSEFIICYAYSVPCTMRTLVLVLRFCLPSGCNCRFAVIADIRNTHILFSSIIVKPIVNAFCSLKTFFCSHHLNFHSQSLLSVCWKNKEMRHSSGYLCFSDIIF